MPSPHSLDRLQSKGRGIIVRDGGDSDVVNLGPMEDVDPGGHSSGTGQHEEKMKKLGGGIIKRRGENATGVRGVDEYNKFFDEHVDRLELSESVPRGWMPSDSTP
eukprot:7233221-Pyramimonas_sp.AAC.1